LFFNILILTSARGVDLHWSRWYS